MAVGSAGGLQAVLHPQRLGRAALGLQGEGGSGASLQRAPVQMVLSDPQRTSPHSAFPPPAGVTPSYTSQVLRLQGLHGSCLPLEGRGCALRRVRVEDS